MSDSILRQEIKRKFIHLSSSVIGFSLIFTNHDWIVPILVVSAVIFPTLDYLRIKYGYVARYYNAIFGTVTRTFESTMLTGASYVFIGAALTAVIFNSKPAAIGLLVMSFSDAFAAIIGIRFGKTRLMNKSLEGSLTFFFITMLIMLAMNVPYFMAFMVASVITWIELVSVPQINDNLLIPISTAFLLTLGGIL